MMKGVPISRSGVTVVERVEERERCCAVVILLYFYCNYFAAFFFVMYVSEYLSSYFIFSRQMGWVSPLACHCIYRQRKPWISGKLSHLLARPASFGAME